ncbi:hypothetical protein F4677DRAFT_407491 [Hypoxylon crocopeplum]|nr:hypothetical protein F4677DRAFT_407491 [Hypoxylon crocopeplum]
MMWDNETTQGKRKGSELLALPKLKVPSARENASSTSTNGHFASQPHALSVDFQCIKGEAVSPCSEVSPTSRCSIVSLSPSLFPLPPTGTTPPTTSHSATPSSPPGTARSQASLTSWFSPPSPPPSAPLPPTPTQKKLASLIADKSGLESLQAPAHAKVKNPPLGTQDVDLAFLVDTPPRTPPRRSTAYTVDSRGHRESVIDPDASLSPPPSSLPPPYSPGFCAPERLSNISLTSSRVDSTVPLVSHPADYYGSPLRPTPEREGRKQRGDAEAGGAGPWQTKPKRRKRKFMMALVGAASAALVMVIAGVAVGVYLAVTGSTPL